MPDGAKSGNAIQIRNNRRYDFAYDRATLSAQRVPPDIAYVDEVSASYIYDPRSKAIPDGWVVLRSAAGGTYSLKGTTLTLPIVGGGSDDWINFVAAANACAARGVTLLFGPGVYTCNTGGLALPSNLHLVCNPLTEVVCDVKTNGSATEAPFLACGDQIPFDNGIITDRLASDTSIGEMKIALSDSTNLVPGDFIVLSVDFRTALYQILAFDPTTRIASLDRPIRLPHGSPTTIASFPAGSIVRKVMPIRNVRIEFNGARIYGNCSRFIEIFDAWKCHFDGPVYCGDGTAATAKERIISIDASSYDCHASRIYGDGGNVTPLGISFESAEGSTFEYCDIRNTVDAGLTFQDAVDCVAIECKCNNNRGEGAAFTAAATGGGTVFGSDHCKIVGGSYSGNGRSGIVFERGSSRCVVDGAQVLSNPGGGIVDLLGNDNLITGKTVVRRNFTGVRTEAESVRFSATNLQVTDQTNGIIVATGAQAVTLTGVNANFNSAAVIIHGEADVSQLSAVAPAGHTTAPFSVTPTGVARVRGLIAAQGAAPRAPTIDVAGVCHLESGDVIQQPGGIGINVNDRGIVRIDTMVEVKGQGEAGTAVNVVDSGIALISDGPRTDPLSIFLGATAKANFGTAVIGENGRVAVTWPFLQATDRVIVSRITGTGDYNVFQTPGVGFEISAKPTDLFNWKID